MNQDIFYICKPSSDEVLLSGDMFSLFENAGALKINGELCYPTVDEKGKSVPGLMFGIMDNGKPYIFPLWGGFVPTA